MFALRRDTQPIFLLIIGILILGFNSVSTGAMEPDAASVAWDDYRECGRVAFYVAAKVQAKQIDWNTACELLGPGDDGMHTFADLERAARWADLPCVAINSPDLDIERLPSPAIIQTISYAGSTRPHFSVYLGIRSKTAFLLDAPHKPISYSIPELRSIWTGRALAFFPAASNASEYANRLNWAGRFAIMNNLMTGLLVAVAAGLCVALLKATVVSQIHSACMRMRQRPFARLVGICLALLIALPGVSFIGSLLIRAESGSSSVGPVLKCEEFIDFGHLGSTKQTKYISAGNVGSAPLQITKISTSCSCVTPEVPRNQILPGSMHRIPLTIQAPPGKKRVDLALHSNDPASPTIVRVETLGVIRPTLCPNRLSFNVLEGAQYERLIKVYYPAGSSEATPTLVSVAGPTSFANFDFESSTSDIHRSGHSEPRFDAIEERRIRVQLSPQAVVVPGRYYFELMLRYGDDQFKYIVPIDITENVSFHLSEDAVIFTSRDAAQPGRCVRELEFPHGQSERDYEIERQVEWCQCSIVSGPKGRKILRLTLVSPPDTGAIFDKLRIAEKTNPNNRTIVSVGFVATR